MMRDHPGCLVAICWCALLLAGPAAAQSNEWKALSKEGSTLYRQGKYDQAMVVAKKMLDIAERDHGPEHPVVATSLTNLAVVYRAQGQYAAAEPLYQRSLAIREKAFGPEHPSVATSLENISKLYTAMGNTEEAKNLADRAAKIREVKRDTEYAELVRNAESIGVAVRFLMSEEEGLLVDAVRKYGTTVNFGQETVTRANVEDFARRLERKVQTLSDAIKQRGFSSVAGEYDVQKDTKNECRLPPESLGPITVTQDKSMVEFKDAAGKLAGSGVIVETSLAMKPGGRGGLSPNFFVGAVTSDRIEMDILDTSGLPYSKCKFGVLIKRRGTEKQ